MGYLAKAAVLVELNAPLRALDLTVPKPVPGQVLVEIAYSGVCHSQINEIDGLKGADPYLPHTLGHEGAGIVREIGAGVRKVSRGDHVVVSWIKGAGADVPSARYGSELGDVNSGAVSTFLTSALVSENRLVRIADGVPLRDAALLGCAIPTGAGTVMNIANPEAENSLAIFGMGGLGQNALIAAVKKGVKTIIAVDRDSGKLALSQSLGATYTINVGDLDPGEAIGELTDGIGVDFAIEATGNVDVMQCAFGSVRTGGGLCIVTGNPPSGDLMAIDPFDLIKGRRIVGSWGGATDIDRDTPVYAGWIEDGSVPAATLAPRDYALADINQAIDDLRSNAVVRPIIDMGLMP